MLYLLQCQWHIVFRLMTAFLSSPNWCERCDFRVVKTYWTRLFSTIDFCLSQINLTGFSIFKCIIKILVRCWVWFSKVQNHNLKMPKSVFKITNLSIGSVKRSLSKVQKQDLQVPLSYISYWKSEKANKIEIEASLYNFGIYMYWKVLFC